MPEIRIRLRSPKDTYQFSAVIHPIVSEAGLHIDPKAYGKALPPRAVHHELELIEPDDDGTVLMRVVKSRHNGNRMVEFLHHLPTQQDAHDAFLAWCLATVAHIEKKDWSFGCYVTEHRCNIRGYMASMHANFQINQVI